MDILNFIYWVKNKRIITSAPDDSLIPIGVPDPRRADKYLSVGIKKSDLISGNSDFTYQIGEYVPSEGGVVFHRYKDAGLENYLITQITDITSSQAWSNITASPVGLAAQTTWDGLSNSDAILAQPGHTSSAAQLCLNLTSESKSDWYLPSVDELSLLWNNRFNVNKTLSGNSAAGVITGANQLPFFTGTYYWSSTEIDGKNSYAFLFDSGTARDYDKGNTYYVRAVRKFTL
jgi:hypothetical protein